MQFKLFADDSVLHRNICNQNVLDTISSWAENG